MKRILPSIITQLKRQSLLLYNKVQMFGFGSSCGKTAMSSTDISLEFLTERPVVRIDEVSELDASIEVSTLGFSSQETRQPINLCIVIDRSGSMQGTKLDTAKKSCIDVFGRLDANDLFTVLVFDSDAYIVVNPSTPKDQVISKINSITSDGQTNLSKGWRLGLLELQTYRTDKHVSRLILLSDGQANEGETKKSVLGNESAQAREFGISTSTIGIGSDFQEELLEVLAIESGGRFWYIGETKIEDIINEEFKGSLSVVLERPRVELKLPQGVTIAKELNKLRKISGKYVVRQITGQDLLRFAVRLEFDPERIASSETEIEARLFNSERLITQKTFKISLVPFNEFILSEENALVSRVVQQHIASTTDEKMRQLSTQDDVDEMKEMLEGQISGMKALEDVLKGERARNWDELELEQRKRLEEDLAELQAELADNQGLLVIVELIDLMKEIGQGRQAHSLLMRWQKIMMHRRHKRDIDRKRHYVDDHMQNEFLSEALSIVSDIIDNQSTDPRFMVIREKIREQLERRN